MCASIHIYTAHDHTTQLLPRITEKEKKSEIRNEKRSDEEIKKGKKRKRRSRMKIKRKVKKARGRQVKKAWRR